MLISCSYIATTFLLFVALWCFKKFTRVFKLIFLSPLRNLPGPKSPSFIFGQLRELLREDNFDVLPQKWVAEYGKTFTFKAWFSTQRLFTIDTRAIHHILIHSHDYQKPEQIRFSLARILGEGLLFSEGDKHRQQRRIMNPAFGPAHIRALTDIFNAKSVKLRDTLMDEIRNIASSNGIDVTVWLSRMTLDAIGLAGFNYSFDALNVNERPNELSEAFNHMVQTAQDINLLTVLQGFIPPLRVISTAQTRVIKKSQQTMTRIGRHLLRDAKAAIRAESDTKTIEKSNVKGKDLLSLLVRANTATDIPDSQRMDDEDVLAQVPTFLAAGHETTSTATTWALYALTQNKAAQTKLRDELLTMDTENPSMDALNALPYLDMVVRETLRLHAPVANSIRVATKDDVIPLETPVVDRYGVQRHEIRIQKGDSIWVPILAVNRSKEIWGEDAHEFRPERWESTPEAAHQIPGVWGNMLTFIGGPRACIGYRFSLVEMKSLLFALVRAFEFDLAVPASEVSKRNVVVTRPLITSDPEEGRQFRLPLIIRPFVRD